MAADSGASKITPVVEIRPGDDPMLARKVGAYETIRRIGQGGMGVVYEARHDKMQQRAAIKFLHQEFSQDDKILQRFFNEARAISLARHSSIVTIYDFGQLDDGTAFILMEFLEGESLLTRLERLRVERKNLDLHTVVELGRQLAAALAVIHSKSIIHRDLKPDNIFIVPDSVAPLGERVKLLDFGIAKFLEGPVRKTTVGMILGTPLYMSPEQCEGAEDLDARVDVYSLGILLYEMVTGQLPFLADTAAALMRQHMFKDPPHLRDEIKEAPAELDALVTQMLAKRADDRPTMDEVAERLEELLPVVAPPGLAITGARRSKTARTRPSQPDSHVADPFAMTLGSPPGQAPVGRPPQRAPVTSATSGSSSQSASALDALGSTGIAPSASVTGQQAVAQSTSSQSGLVVAARPRLLPQSDGSRTDTVVAIGRRPVNLIIAVVLLLLLAVVSWRTLSKKPGPDHSSPVGPDSTQTPTSVPKVVTPPPGEPVEPAPAPLDKAGAAGEAREHGENKHHPKHHKKNGDGARSDDKPADTVGKKGKGGKSDSAEKAWDVDDRAQTF